MEQLERERIDESERNEATWTPREREIGWQSSPDCIHEVPAGQCRECADEMAEIED